MAYDIVNGLENKNKVDLLKQLKEGVEPKEKLKGKKHQVFTYPLVQENVLEGK